LESDSDRLEINSENEIEILNQIIGDIEKIYRTINSLFSKCKKINEFIVDIKNEADNAITTSGGYNGDTADSIHNKLKKLLETVKQKEKEFNTKRMECYNQITEITGKDGLQQKFYLLAEDLRKKIKKKENDINDDIVRSKEYIKKEKHITKWFIISQVCLLLLFLTIYVPLFGKEKVEMIFYWLNAFWMVCYIILVYNQFNKYNKKVTRLNKLSNEKRKHRQPSKLIWSIILACTIFTFLPQLSFLIEYYMGFNNIYESGVSLPFTAIFSNLYTYIIIGGVILLLSNCYEINGPLFR